MSPSIPLGLYVHLPWCVRKCPYCDFNSHQIGSRIPDAAYVDALLADFDLELPWIEGRAIDTVFFGGGTPSLFPPGEYARLLEGLARRVEFAADAEITLEANPGTIEHGRFAEYRRAGINRVSLGAQSFSASALQALGRIHGPQDTLRAVEELRAARIDNFNLDLMYALPGQSPGEALEDVRLACELGPSHISYYQLTLEPGTVFHARPPPLPDEGTAWEIQCAGQAALARAGFVQYEVSAYARDGARCRHNLNYWRFGDYAGIGAGAHGKLSLSLPDGVLRTAKPKQPREYVERVGRAAADRARAAANGAAAASSARPPGVGEVSAVAAADLPFEFMLNALRLNEGFSEREFQERTGLPLAAVAEGLSQARSRALLEREGTTWRATGLGLRFLNDLQGIFLG